MIHGHSHLQGFYMGVLSLVVLGIVLFACAPKAR